MLKLLREMHFLPRLKRNETAYLQSAAITPYETRELLKDYLESLSSRFKVGISIRCEKDG